MPALLRLLRSGGAASLVRRVLVTFGVIVVITAVIGAAPIALGVIEGLAEAAAGLTKLYSGRASDRFGRKPFVVAGYGLAGIGKLFVVLSTTWGGVLFGRVTDRIGKGMRSAPRDALIGDGIDEKHLGKAFGFHRMSDRNPVNRSFYVNATRILT